MEWLAGGLALALLASLFYAAKLGAKAERGEQHDAHMKGDDEFHQRGEDWDASGGLAGRLSDDD